MSDRSEGTHVWYELMTTDPAGAARFYGNVIGWSAKDSGVPGVDYTLFSMGERAVGGTMALPEAALAMGAKPVWLAYLAVADVDAMARRIEAAGGRIYQPAKDIPGVGRFAAAGDPQGAPFVVFRGSAAVDPGPTPMGATGFINWHELHTTDREGGFAFYAGLFGWTKADAVDMGPMGTYQMFATQGLMAGGMMQQEGRPFWLYYINVEAIDAAVARVAAGGGKLLSGPQQVPGGSWVAQCLDPQGVKFAVVSQQR